MAAIRAVVVLLSALAAALSAHAGVEEALRESAVLLTSGDVGGARAKAEEAVAASPNDPRAQEQLGHAALAALDAKAAESAAARALQSGETPARLILRANARRANGNYDGARADAERAARLSPGSGRARLAVATAMEAQRLPGATVSKEYRRAAELDASLGAELEAALRRLDDRRIDSTAPAPGLKGSGLGSIMVILAISALFGWIFGKVMKTEESATAEGLPAPLLPGSGRLSARQALAAADAAAKAGAPDPFALAEALYQRLTGRPAFPRGADRALGRYLPASETVKGLPAGVDAFFARALDPEASRRFATASELVGAFRSLVDPPIL